MNKYIISVALLLIVISTSSAQYTVQSPYLLDPSLAIGYVDSCAQFWLPSYDYERGGFYTNVDRYGNVYEEWGTNKNMISQSRTAYGMVRAYMLTGNNEYLDLARDALQFMIDHAWDEDHDGWISELDEDGNPLNRYNNRSAFDQHYALLGIAAYYEATGDPYFLDVLLDGYQYLEDFFWDSTPGREGYFDVVNYIGGSQRNKTFNATVDAITTHLLYLYLMTGEEQYRERLWQVGENIVDHLVGSMPEQTIGFAEHYDSEWNVNENETMTIMGHVLKSAWCLGRIQHIAPGMEWLPNAETLALEVWDNGYDHVYGGPYKDYNRQTGEMLLWGLQDSTKAWWQMEQAIVAGLELYDLTMDTTYLQMADETLEFYMEYFVDHEYGDVYADRTRYGGFAWNTVKGQGGKAGYHSIETGYYTYLYGSFFYQDQPATLFYSFRADEEDRNIVLTPLAIESSRLVIESVLLEDESYDGFDGETRTLFIPASMEGEFAVTFAPVESGVRDYETIEIMPADFVLHQNYPNPFNSMTMIRVEANRETEARVAVYNTLGQAVMTLHDGLLTRGINTFSLEMDGYSSGLYYVRVDDNTGSETINILMVR